ncbi:MAG: hypothetical protein K0Q59_3218 [Paenibacillus sp.]|nr:hypothetical protein [Paenibacillus sp.]
MMMKLDKAGHGTRAIVRALLFSMIWGLFGQMYPSAPVFASSTVIIDYGNAGYTEYGVWRDSGLKGYNNSGTRYANTVNSQVYWAPDLEAGTYAVYVYKIYHATNSSVQSYTISTGSGIATATMDFTIGSSGWELLGEYAFSGSGSYVQLVNPSGAYVRADAVKFERQLDEEEIHVRVNGDYQQYDETPVLVDDVAFVSALDLMDAIEAQATWNAGTSTLTAEKSGTTLNLTAGSAAASLNGQPLALDAAPYIVNGTLMVPVMQVAESLGAEAVWTASSKTVDVYVVRTIGELTEIPYPPDLSNRAGWWSPIEASDGNVYMAFSGRGVTEGFHTIQVAHRNLSNQWSSIPVYEDVYGTIAEYPNDAGHRQSSIAIDGSGRLHLFGSMHTSPWNYYRDDGNGGAFLNRSNEMPDQHTTFTYPVVRSAPNGDLYLIVRADEYMNAVDQKREGKLYRWDNANDAWSAVGTFAGETDRAVYPQDVQIDADGTVHILYEWSPYPSGALRHQLSYIKYVPAANTWVDHTGSTMNVPVNVSASDTIVPFAVDEQWGGDSYTGPAVQTAKMAIHNGAVSVIYRHRDTDGGVFKVKAAYTANGSPWASEDVYGATSTSASVAISVSDGQTRLFYARSGNAYMAYKTAGGAYTSVQLTTGRSITHLASTHADGTDYLYLVGYRSETSTLGAYIRLNFRTVQPLAAPVITGTTAGSGQVALSWTPIEGASEYAIWSATASGAYGNTPAMTVGQAVYSATLNGLTGGVDHYFVVRAKNSVLESASSGEAGATPY